MKVLITGVGGFIGDHLIDMLLSKGCNILGTDLGETNNGADKRIPVKQCDVTNREQVELILEEFKPDVIFHLAAQSWPDISWQKPNLTMKVNIEGTINVYESIKKLKLDPLVFIPCSGAEYGDLKAEEYPVKEEHNLMPINPYGVSKVVQSMLAYQYYKNFNIRSITIRLFNASGPRRIKDVCSDFTKSAVMIEKGLIEPVMKVGNLESKRAITDVRDVMDAIWLLINTGKVGETYNICSPNAYSIRKILNLVLELTGINPQVWQDPTLMRPADEKIIMGDTKKLMSHTGWFAKISIENTLKDMISDWRLKL